jgi:putative PIN family toxin of toxin-antitoxin system
MLRDEVVIDTNVILSGLKSKKGCSYKLLDFISQDKVTFSISVPLILEYESILLKFKDTIGLTVRDIRDFIDYLCKVGNQTKIYYLWRPILKDPFDDHILEVAVNSESKYIITQSSHTKSSRKTTRKFRCNSLMNS